MGVSYIRGKGLVFAILRGIVYANASAIRIMGLLCGSGALDPSRGLGMTRMEWIGMTEWPF